MSPPEVASLSELWALLKLASETGQGITELDLLCSITQEALDTIGRDHGGTLTSLSIRPCSVNSSLDNLRITKLTSALFPQLRFLFLQYTWMECLELQLPMLQDLTLEELSSMEGFSLDCPNLQHLSMNISNFDDCKDLGPSLSRSPLLQSATFFQVLGLGLRQIQGCHLLVLPACSLLDLSRCSDLDYLKLYAPNLSELNLHGCYSLEFVHLLDRPPFGFPPEPARGLRHKNLRVNLTDANRGFKGNLMSHPRNITPRAYFNSDAWDRDEDCFDPETGFTGPSVIGLNDEEDPLDGFLPAQMRDEIVDELKDSNVSESLLNGLMAIMVSSKEARQQSSDSSGGIKSGDAHTTAQSQGMGRSLEEGPWSGSHNAIRPARKFKRRSADYASTTTTSSGSPVQSNATG